jgi:hypothetical protein
MLTCNVSEYIARIEREQDESEAASAPKMRG